MNNDKMAKQRREEKIKKAEVEVSKQFKPETQYLEFIFVEEKKATNVYAVQNVDHDYIIGLIKWYGGWRKYTFYTNGSIMLSPGCMRDICRFIETLMYTRDKIKKKEKSLKETQKVKESVEGQSLWDNDIGKGPVEYICSRCGSKKIVEMKEAKRLHKQGMCDNCKGRR